ncbi:MAG: hypothetical protein JNM25_13910 [Planctomycetes bacterium]|nr:hypothetical protein [Planctomycetota bacterium]
MMKRVVMAACVWFGLMACVGAQEAAPDVGKPAREARSGPVLSAAGREALAGGREIVNRLRGLRGPERKLALEQAASAHDRLVEQFAGEPLVAAAAAFAAAELWRQQGSLAIAEKDYLRAAALDAPRFAQRGLLGAADMQRRQLRVDEAMGTYGKAEAVEPGSSRAQDARLWRARLLQGSERLDEAIAAFQSALECANGVSQVIETANFLALALVQKGDLDAAGRAIQHAEHAVETAAEDDATLAERHQKWLAAMSARNALQRARDERDGAAEDAVQFDAARRGSR